MSKVLDNAEIGIRIDFHGSRFGRFPMSATPDAIIKLQQAQSDEFWRLVKRHVEPHMEGDFGMQQTVKLHHKCSHCGYQWTEDSDTYNGGCCEADEANNPAASNVEAA